MRQITLYMEHGLTVEEGATVEVAPGTTLNLQSNASTGDPTAAVNFVIDGRIHAPGGTVNLGGVASTLHFGSHAVVDVSGTWVNDQLGPQQSTPRAINGGSVIVTGNLDVQPGAVLDVSGGGWVQPRQAGAQSR